MPMFVEVLQNVFRGGLRLGRRQKRVSGSVKFGDAG